MLIGVEYIKYRWKAKGRHGIHSPFVFDLVDKCQHIAIDATDKQLLAKLFSTLKNDESVINVKDFGAGSKSLSKQRKISAIFKTSSSRGKYGKLLYQLCRHYQPAHILELGTSLGVGTIHMQLGAPQAVITTVEACPATRKTALRNFEMLPSHQINSIESTFVNFFETGNLPHFDLVFIDGHHDGEYLLHYLELVAPFTSDETIFLLDDIRWSASMKNAWESLVMNEDYHVTIDFFRMGMLVRRSHQEKEQFQIRV